MTQRQAWLTMARAYYTPENKRTEKQVILADDGICLATLELFQEDGLGVETLQSMDNDLEYDVKCYTDEGYFCTVRGWSDFDPANDLLRADYCMLQYYMLGGK